ncbi:MAG: hypothetical protein EON55_21545 [Alphaproteobacteria bacterium]|nr:MAG: hypothetical protein EON55_21545 [Alphaproteobacteria bacterium]
MSVDTLSLARELKAVDLPVAQAEAIAAAIGRTAADNLNAAATRSDLAIVRSDLAQAESRLETKIEQLCSNLIMGFVGTNFTMAAIIIAASKL